MEYSKKGKFIFWWLFGLFCIFWPVILIIDITAPRLIVVLLIILLNLVVMVYDVLEQILENLKGFNKGV